MRSRRSLPKPFSAYQVLCYLILMTMFSLVLGMPVQADDPTTTPNSAILSTTTIAQAAAPTESSSDDYLSTTTPIMENYSNIEVVLQYLQEIGDTFGCTDWWGFSEITGYKITYYGSFGTNPTFFSAVDDNISEDSTRRKIEITPGADLGNAVGALFFTADVQVYCNGTLSTSTYTSNWAEVFLNPSQVLTLSPPIVSMGSPVAVTFNGFDTFAGSPYNNCTLDTVIFASNLMDGYEGFDDGGTWKGRWQSGLPANTKTVTGVFTPTNAGVSSITAYVNGEDMDCTISRNFSVPLTPSFVSASPAIADANTSMAVSVGGLSGIYTDGTCSLSFRTNRGAGIDFFNPTSVTPSSSIATTSLTSATPGVAQVIVDTICEGDFASDSQQDVGNFLPVAFGTGTLPTLFVMPQGPSLNGRFFPDSGQSVNTDLVIQAMSTAGSITGVTLVVNGVDYPATYDPDQYGYLITPSQPIALNLAPQENTVQIEATDSAGNNVVQVYSPYGGALPSWIADAMDEHPFLKGGFTYTPASQTYDAYLQFPKGGFSSEAVALIKPALGLHSVTDFYADLSIPTACDQQVTVDFNAGNSKDKYGAGGSGAPAISQQANGTIYGVAMAATDLNVDGQMTEVPGSWQGCAISDEFSGTVAGDVTVTGAVNYGLVEVVGDIFTAGAVTDLRDFLSEIPVVNQYTTDVMDILGSVTVDASVGGGISTQLQTQAASPYVQMGTFSISPTVAIGSYGDLGLDNWVITTAGEYNVSIGGLVNFHNIAGAPLFDPNSTIDFGDVELDGSVGIDFAVGALGNTTKYGWEWLGQCVYPVPANGSSCSGWEAPPSSALASQSGWRLIPHPTDIDYAVFRANPEQRRALDGATPEADGLFMSNVYTYTEVALAANPLNDQVMMLWSGDDLNKPLGQSHEIYFSLWDGAAWSTPAAVTDDDLMDGTPALAWTAEGQAVAVWQRYSQPLPIDATLDLTSTNLLELVTAVYTPLTNSWSAPVALTPPDTANSFPKLARNPDGKLLLTWKQYQGDSRRLMAAFHHDGQWGAPVAAVAGNVDLLGWNAAYAGTEATVAFSRMITSTRVTTPTEQILTSAWNGSAWSAARPFVDGYASHTSPAVVYNAVSEPQLVWVGEDALHIRNLSTGVGQQSPALGLSGIADLKAVTDAAGNTAAIFTGRAGERGLHIAYYDQTRQKWGFAHRLTDLGQLRENRPSVSLDSTGQVWLGYTTRVMSQAPVTVTLSSGRIVSSTRPVPGRTDLRVLTYTPQQNLAFTPDGLQVDRNYALPGRSLVLTATVRNAGDLMIDGATVGFYDGDPTAGGTLIRKLQQNVSLAAGYTATFTTTYPVLAETGSRTLYAVADPDRALDALDTSQYVVTRTVLGPDLQLDGARVVSLGWDSVSFMATIRNIGNTTSPTTTLTYDQVEPAGPRLITQSVPALQPGAAISLTTPWRYGSLPVGQYRLLAGVNEHDFSELHYGNNTRVFRLTIQPDLMVDAANLRVTPLPGADGGLTSQITATVYNVSPFPATNVEVAFYAGAVAEGSRLFTRTIAALPPASRVDIGGMAILTDCLVIAQIDPHIKMRDNRDNNLAAVRASDSACLGRKLYLPIIVNATMTH